MKIANEEKEQRYYITTVSLTEEQYRYMKANIPNFSEWVREKLNEEMGKPSILKKFKKILNADLGIIRDEEGKLWFALIVKDDNGVVSHKKISRVEVREE